MSRPPATGLAHSVQARLKNHAEAQDRPFMEVLELYAVERFLYRLSRSAYRDSLVLKGAMMLRHWLGRQTRPTRDVDLHAPGDLDEDAASEIILAILRTPVEDDGLEYAFNTLTVSRIRAESPVLGIRARFNAFLGPAVIRHQVDFGVGDSIHPDPVEVTPPPVLDLPVASVRAYTPYTAVAEKLEAIVVLGEANSRMKDYFDLATMSAELDFSGSVLVECLRQTFASRATTLPDAIPPGLDQAFGRTAARQRQWEGYLRKARLNDIGWSLTRAVERVRRFALPPLLATGREVAFDRHWPPGGPWKESEGA